jgi:hypothetical protein
MITWRTILPSCAIIVGAALAPTVVDALTFTPERIDTQVYPGVPHKVELTLFNEASESISVALEPVLLDIIDAASGQASFLLNSAGDPSLSWLSVTPNQFVLVSGEQRNVIVEVLAPETSSGSLMAGIAASFRSVRSGEGGDISVIAVTGPYIFAEVLSKDSVVQGDIEFIRSTGGSKWFSSQPVSLEVSFANRGNVHLKPQGVIEVRDIFGRIHDQITINEEQRTVLAETSRTFDIIWGGHAEERISNFKREFQKPLIGPFRLTVTMTYGEDAIDTTQLTLWAVPWRSLVLLSTISIGIVAARRRLKRV